MSQPKLGPNQTVKQMWEAFERQVLRNQPGRKLSAEFQATYNARAHNMLARVMDMLRHGDPGEFGTIWQRPTDEMVRFSRDYQSGKIWGTARPFH